MEAQTLLLNQITKIFTIIEKSLDNNEICKIAIETLSNKCLETPIFIFPILTNLIEMASKGNLKIIEDSTSLIESFFEDLSTKEFIKIFKDEIFKNQFLSFLNNNEFSLHDTNCYIINSKTFQIENINEMSYITFDIFTNLNTDTFEYLYSKDKDLSQNTNQTGNYLSDRELNLYFPNQDETRREIEMGMKKAKLLNENDDSIEQYQSNKLNVNEYYIDKSKKLDLINEPLFNNSNKHLSSCSSNKKRKVNEDSIQKQTTIYLNPFYSFINELIPINSQSYQQRLCSITLLRTLQKFYNKILFTFYPITIISSSNAIDDIIIDKPLICSTSFKKHFIITLISKLVLNSILDKVVDYNNTDYICMSKELNLKLVSLLFDELEDENDSTYFISQMLCLLKHFFNTSDDWQFLYAILTLFKYLFQCKNFHIKDKSSLFEYLSNLMKTNSEDILTLIIQILDKILDNKQLINYINNDIITEMFLKFIALIHRYDDIESGVRFYFNCLNSFIFYYLNQPDDNIKQTEKIFNELKILMNNEFILHSINKITSVRIKYFEVLNNLLLGSKNGKKFEFDYQFIEKNCLLAFQGLCIEEDKLLLKSQHYFLMIVLSQNPTLYINIFITHKDNLLKLLLKEHISNLEHFYIPQSEKYDKSELEEVYKSFLLNQIQTDLITKANERKLFYIIPILSFILKIKVDFIDIIYEKFGINNIFVLKRELLIILKIYVYYLQFIETDINKTLIITDDILKCFSENTSLNELPIHVDKINIESSIKIILHYFYEFTKSIMNDETILLNNLTSIMNSLQYYQTLNVKELNDVMKHIYDKVKVSNNSINLKQCCDHIKRIKDALNNIEKSQNIPLLRQKIRGYASACLFDHSVYTGVKYNKISNITNAFLNCLKLNNKEAQMFVKYLLKLIINLDNEETKTKIVGTMIDNSIKVYIDNQNNGNQFVFLPTKYFFREFAECERYNEVQKMINDYETNLLNKKEEQIEIKMFIFLYLLSAVKQNLYAYPFEKFKLFFYKFDKYITYPNIVNIFSTIITNSDKLFTQEYQMKQFLEILFNSIDLQKQSIDINIFILQVLEKVLQNNKISTLSIDFIFITLLYINNKNEHIRQLATSIFSIQMKIISMLKFDTNYDQIASSTNVTSLDFITKIFTQNIDDIKEVNIKLKENLRTYQLIGINWLLFLGNYGLGLALCDDMGLGKTIQTLVSIAQSSIEYKDKTGHMPISLIICPTTLILNWINESKKFFNDKDLCILTIESSNDDKTNTPLLLKPKNKNIVTIYITSYEKVRENYNEVFTKNNFFYLVLDEAHIAKNPKTKMYQSIRKINSERRVILTGTPIQNNVMELWALFDFLMPGFLGNENDFEIKYHKKMHSNIKKLNLEEKLQENIFQTSLSEIKKRIKPFILRRLKADVLQELPEKIIDDYVCEMTPSQQEMYDHYIKLEEQPNKKESSLSLIDKLRKICNHPALLKNDNFHFANMSKNEKTNLVNGSGKLKSLEELLISLGFEQGNNEGSLSYENKVLIFTQYKPMCFLLKVFLSEKFPSLNVLLLTSDTKPNERSGIIMKFNSDPTVHIMILTTSIGGLGINLTSANIVIMYDHNWNPTKDMQAIDRAHRIGQKKSVRVFRMITLKSIEQQLISLQTFKKYIANNVVDTNKVSENKVNASSVMESFEEFSNNKLNMKSHVQKRKRKKISKIEELTRENEEEIKREEMEIEYLKTLIS